MTKITGLTALNVRALREVLPIAVEDKKIVLTKTTATFDETPLFWVAALKTKMSQLPAGQHPRHSLHAVVRKLEKAALAKIRADIDAGEREGEFVGEHTEDISYKLD